MEDLIKTIFAVLQTETGIVGVILGFGWFQQIVQHMNSIKRATKADQERTALFKEMTVATNHNTATLGKLKTAFETFITMQGRGG